VSAAALAVLLGAALPAAARAQDPSLAACLESAAHQPRTVFEVVISTFPTVVERRYFLREINRLRSTQTSPGALAHGLCVANYRLRYSTRTEATCWRPGGHACAWLGKVVVDLTPDDIHVYIPKEYPSQSCESKQLLLHEFEHEELHRRRLAQLVDRMRLALARAKNLPGPTEPINAATPEEAHARLKRVVDAVLRPIYRNYLKEIQVEQETLDDPESYRRLGDKCSGWKRS
jgi:hypothetical protein